MLEEILKPSKIAKNVILLGFVSFFSDLSSELYFAILPFLIINLGGNGLVVGLIAGITDAFVAFLKIVFGFLSDHLTAGRKKYVYWGYSLPSFFKALMTVATTWSSLLVLRLLERVGKGIRTAPRDALISSSSKKQSVGKSFGFHRAMDSFGAVLGATLALFLLIFNMNFQSILLTSAILGLLTLIPIRLVNEESHTIKSKKQKIDLNNFSNSVDKRYWKVLIFTFFHGTSLISYMFFVLHSEQTSPPSRLTPIEFGIAGYVLFNIIYAIMSYIAGILADRTSISFILAMGSLFQILSVVSFIALSGITQFILGFTLLGIAYGCNEGNVKAIVSDLVPENFKATGYGIQGGLLGISILIGNIVAGWFFDKNYIIAFAFAGVSAVISGLIIILNRK